MSTSPQTCEACWHWRRTPHFLDMEFGWCGLFERTMRAPEVCGMWETSMTLIGDEPAVKRDTQDTRLTVIDNNSEK